MVPYTIFFFKLSIFNKTVFNSSIVIVSGCIVFLINSISPCIPIYNSGFDSFPYS